MYSECLLRSRLEIPANKGPKLKTSIANMSTKNINRITLFKIPDVPNQEKLLAIYKNLQQNAQKVSPALSPLP
jgi:hypothetical protein